MIKDSGERPIFQQEPFAICTKARAIWCRSRTRLSYGSVNIMKLGPRNTGAGIIQKEFRVHRSSILLLGIYLSISTDGDDEDHLAAAAFNVLGAMEMEAHHAEMIDIPNREGKHCFEYSE